MKSSDFEIKHAVFKKQVLIFWFDLRFSLTFKRIDKKNTQWTFWYLKSFPLFWNESTINYNRFVQYRTRIFFSILELTSRRRWGRKNVLDVRILKASPLIKSIFHSKKFLRLFFQNFCSNLKFGTLLTPIIFRTF